MPDLRKTGLESEPPQGSWVFRSRWRAVAIAFGTGGSVFCTAFFSQHYLRGLGVEPMPMLSGSDLFAAALATILVLRLLFHNIERRRVLRERLRAITEINHHIRNGLEMIQLSAQSTQDQHAIMVIREGVERIEWTLRQMLGPGGPLGDGWNYSDADTGAGKVKVAGDEEKPGRG